ncbi:uncharacterized protein LOC62_01G001312 [Vanrija pseudolonga]|uniref:Uncharacterized protein n=1 Tax=Vanrija pseudolonga TaxID=143232 RepID=A0AAF1BHL7_9TREE|nr:hypothetical protein LOC62_01G001312 [Vanrija pseudolonga]
MKPHGAPRLTPLDEQAQAFEELRQYLQYAHTENGEDGPDDQTIQPSRPPPGQDGSPRAHLTALRSVFSNARKPVPLRQDQASRLAAASHARPELKRLRDPNQCQLGPGLVAVMAIFSPTATFTNEVIIGNVVVSQTVDARILAPAEVSAVLVDIVGRKGQYLILDKEAVLVTAFLHKVVTGALYRAVQNTNHALALIFTFGEEPIPFAAIFPCASLTVPAAVLDGQATISWQYTNATDIQAAMSSLRRTYPGCDSFHEAVEANHRMETKGVVLQGVENMDAVRSIATVPVPGTRLLADVTGSITYEPRDEPLHFCRNALLSTGRHSFRSLVRQPDVSPPRLRRDRQRSLTDAFWNGQSVKLEVSILVHDTEGHGATTQTKWTGREAVNVPFPRSIDPHLALAYSHVNALLTTTVVKDWAAQLQLLGATEGGEIHLISVGVLVHSGNATRAVAYTRAVVVTSIPPHIAAPVFELLQHPMRVRFGMHVQPKDQGFQVTMSRPTLKTGDAAAKKKEPDLLELFPALTSLVRPRVCLYATEAGISVIAKELAKSDGPMHGDLRLAEAYLRLLKAKAPPQAILAAQRALEKKYRPDVEGIKARLAAPKGPPPKKRLASDFYKPLQPKYARHT